MAPSEFQPQLSAAGGATRRPRWQRPATTPARAAATQRRCRAVVDHHRRAPGNRVVDRPDGAVLHAAAAANRNGLELAVADTRGGSRLALARTPDQCLLRTGAGGVGADLCRLRLQSLSEPAHTTGSLGYRTGVSPLATAPEQRCIGSAAGGLSGAAECAFGVGGRAG
ncbi:hypothetical protein D3C81_1558040 [compost metagenome]